VAKVLHIIGPLKGYGCPILESKDFSKQGELLPPHLGIKCFFIPITNKLPNNPFMTNIPYVDG
jgi:hypothetical protein